jgi:predicted amidohydrolase
VKICIAQISPAYLDRDQTVARTCAAIAEAAANGARLVVFPEVWLSGYPYWSESWESDLARWVEGRRWFFDAALSVPSEDTERIGEALRRAGVYCVLGCNEMDPRPGVNTIYNSLLFFDRDGSLMGRHRKLLPTFIEKLFWGRGDAGDLAVYETEIGRIGGLICGENLVTSIRSAMIGMGEDFHIAVYPGAFSLTGGPRLQECDNSGAFWGHTVTRAHALEAGCYTLCACGYLDPNDVPEDFPYLGRMHVDWSRGGSQVVEPFGVPLVEPVEGSQLVYAVCKADHVKAFKAICDTVGHYSRPDVVRVLLRGDRGWADAGEPYVSGHERRPPRGELRRAADAHEVDEHRVARLADDLGLPAS